jgi:hypothetical protein
VTVAADSVSPTGAPVLPELHASTQDAFDGALNSPPGTEHIAPVLTPAQAAAATAHRAAPAALRQPDESDRLARVFATSSTLALAALSLFAWLQ